MAELQLTSLDIHLIVPFRYDRENFRGLATGQIPDVLEDFEPVSVKADRVRRGTSRLDIPRKGILGPGTRPHIGTVPSYKLREQKRKELGLRGGSRRGSWLFPLKKEQIPIRIGDIHLIFFSGGSGFLVFHTSFLPMGERKTLTGEEALNLHNQLAQLKRHIVIEKPVQCRRPGEKEELTFARMVQELLAMLSSLRPQVTAEDMRQAHTVVCAVSPGYPEETELGKKTVSREQWETMMAGCEASTFGLRKDRVEESWWGVDYIRWRAGRRSLCAFADQDAAGDSENFLKSDFPYSVGRNYLMIYLYYLQMQLTCDHLQNEIRKYRNRDEEKVSIDPAVIRDLAALDGEFPPLGEHEIIDAMFEDRILNGPGKLKERVRSMKAEHTFWLQEHCRYSVFISYRREGGYYPAQLIHTFLVKYGKRTFLDKDSLQEGHFDEAIYDCIDHCDCVISVLTKGALDRCGEKEDWVRKELVHSMKAKKRIIPVIVDDFSYPEALPEEMGDFATINGVIMNPDTFHSAIHTILERIEGAGEKVRGS